VITSRPFRIDIAILQRRGIAPPRESQQMPAAFRGCYDTAHERQYRAWHPRDAPDIIVAVPRHIARDISRRRNPRRHS
jgi:hypothetical protein